MFTDIHLINLRIMAEVLLACHMLGRFLPHREHCAPLAALTAAAALLLAYLFPVPAFAMRRYVGWGLLMYGSLFAMAAASLALCYRETPMAIFCCTVTGYTVHQMESALNGLLNTVTPLPPMAAWLLAAIPVYILCYALLSGPIRRTGRIRIDGRRIPMLSAAVLMVDILSGLVLLQLQSTYDAPGYAAMLNLMNMLGCGFVLSLQSSLISNRELQLELELTGQMLREEKRQYERSRSSIDLINRKCHDLKHQLRTLRHRQGEVDRGELKEIEQAVEMYDTSVCTGSAALDVILTEKKLLCESRGIRLTCMADGGGMNHVAAPDIYALFGNILDNAIEAAEQLPDPETRTISLIVRQTAGMTVIREENPFAGELRFRDGIPETGKGDTDYHGFGIRSIRAIAEKYGGTVTLAAGDGLFTLNAVLLRD